MTHYKMQTSFPSNDKGRIRKKKKILKGVHTQADRLDQICIKGCERSVYEKNSEII